MIMKAQESGRVKAVLSENGEMYLTVNGGKQNPDFRQYAGNERILIREYDSISQNSWEHGKAGIKADARFLRRAAAMGLLIDENGNELTLLEGIHTLSVNVSEHDGNVSFSVSIAGTDGGVDAIADNMILSGSELVEIEGFHENIGALKKLQETTVRKSDLGVFLSVLLSKNDGIKLTMDGYQTIEKKSIAASPALIFQEIDEYGYLHILTDSHIDGFAAGTISKNNITRKVDVNEDDKTLEIRDIVFLEDPVKLFMKMLGRNTKNSVYEENGYFIIDGPFAEDFLSARFSELAASFALYHAEVLAKYRIRYARPAVHFRFTSGVDFLEGDGSVEIGRETMDLETFLSSYRKNEGYVLLNDKSKAYIESAFIRKLERIVRYRNGKAVVSKYDLPYLEEAKGISIEGEGTESVRKFYKGFNSIKNLEYNTGIKTSKLRGYQEDGYRWLRYLHDSGMGGCLADEMGLGKTVQVIALLNDVLKEAATPSLLIVPKSVIYNWLSEIEKFGIGLSPVLYYGPERNIEALQSTGNKIIVSSYATVRNDIDKLSELQFYYVILDESQIVKHFNTRTAQAVLNLNAKHRIAMSGTPIENDLGELFSLFRFINPAIFPSLSAFERDFVKPIMNDDKEAEKELRMRIYPFILRRLKKDVLKELPEKTEQIAYIEMTDEHKAFYESRRIDLREKVNGELCRNGRDKSTFIILQALTELRQIAALPEGKMKTDTISAKREYLKAVLPEITANGHKALIFTSFLDTIEKLGEDLSECGIGFVTMTGATQDRKNLVARFQTDPQTKVFLMTLKTGGVGLNLTAADYVFIFDPWWNAAAEDQAINRTHRIGQENPVFCYRLIAKDTIEEKILKLQNMKKELSSALITSDGTALKTLTEDEIEELLE